MAEDIVFRSARIVTPEGVVDGDLAVTGGRITAIGPDLPDAGLAIECGGDWLMPGGVDPHAHIEQVSGKGLLNADTFETATRSAAIGGTTSVLSFAAQRRGERVADVLDDYSARARRGAAIDHAFHLIVSDPEAADFDTDLAAAVAAGHRSLKVFTTYDIRLDDGQIIALLAACRRHGALLCVHAENHALIDWSTTALLQAGRTRPADHAASHPRLAEIEALERMCRFAEFFATPVMLFHVSTAEGVEVVRAARARGAPVRAETCTHYLFQTESVLDQPGLEGAKWMCSPPQRDEADRQALWAGLLDGTLSLVSSDHAPYRFDDSGKLSAGPGAAFPDIANGLPGLEPRLPMLFHAMVQEGRGGAEAFARLTAQAAADLYALPGKGRIEVGADADLVLWDRSATRTFGASDLSDNVGYNPYEGQVAAAPPRHVFLRGREIARNGVFLGQPGQGRWLRRDGLGFGTDAAPDRVVTLGEETQT